MIRRRDGRARRHISRRISSGRRGKGDIVGRKKLLGRLRKEVSFEQSESDLKYLNYFREKHRERRGPNGEPVGEWRIPRVEFDIEGLIGSGD